MPRRGVEASIRSTAYTNAIATRPALPPLPARVLPNALLFVLFLFSRSTGSLRGLSIHPYRWGCLSYRLTVNYWGLCGRCGHGNIRYCSGRDSWTAISSVNGDGRGQSDTWLGRRSEVDGGRSGVPCHGAVQGRFGAAARVE